MSKNVTRKDFLKRAGLLSLGALSASALITACGGGEEPAASSSSKGPMKAPPPPPKKKEVAPTEAKPEAIVEADCTELNANLTEEDKATRTAVMYVDQSQEAGKNCTNCRFWQPDKFEGPCGGCLLFANGAVNPNGYCGSWAAPDA